LLLVLVAIAGTDLLFALDSIPATFGVTSEPYLVFTANAAALLGLRALYFLLHGLLERLVYLSLSLAAILIFIGVKLVLVYAHETWAGIPAIPTGMSLGIIAVILLVGVVASLRTTNRDPSRIAHAGRLTHDDTSASG
jgi:tellurite resistance protein TerC